MIQNLYKVDTDSTNCQLTVEVLAVAYVIPNVEKSNDMTIKNNTDDTKNLINITV